MGVINNYIIKIKNEKTILKLEIIRGYKAIVYGRCYVL